MPGITDVHVHLEPYKNLKPAVFGTMRRTMPDFDAMARKMEDPRNLLAHLDAVGVERACLINYAAPEVMGLGLDVNGFVSKYASEDPRRLLAFGGIHPWLTKDPEGDVERLVSRHELRGIKIHPPHQLFAPNAYVDGKMPNLWRIYRAAERVHLPIMFHTGTSVFPGARSKFGDPMALDDVATDFPDLTILMAHGGRPLWCDTAFYLLRAHNNVYLDISSIPPARLLEWFPQIEKIADKILFGSDWPGPGIPGIKEEIDGVKALPLSDSLREKMFVANARKIFR
ncbi:MAG TPA: amidohydrolase family protein [Thermoplasmata archaeon]|nr:amidohydrolase family protein [Thermoplasmata archaeon]